MAVVVRKVAVKYAKRKEVATIREEMNDHNVCNEWNGNNRSAEEKIST